MTLIARCSHGFRNPVRLISVSMELVRVSEMLQYRIVPGRFEELQDGAKDFVQDRIGMPDVEIERIEVATKTEFRLIIQRAAPVTFETLFQRPSQNIAQCVKVEMEIERHPIIEADVIVVDRPVMDERDAEGNRLSVLSPDKEARAIRHASAELG